MAAAKTWRRLKGENLLPKVVENAGRQLRELLYVIVTFPWRRAVVEGVCIRDLVGNHATVFHGDLHTAATLFLARIGCMVALGPFGILDGRDLVPKRDSVGTMGALGRKRLDVTPRALRAAATSRRLITPLLLPLLQPERRDGVVVTEVWEAVAELPCRSLDVVPSGLVDHRALFPRIGLASGIPSTVIDE